MTLNIGPTKRYLGKMQNNDLLNEDEKTPFVFFFLQIDLNK